MRPAPPWKSVMVHVAGDVAEYEAEWSEVVHPHRTLVFFSALGALGFGREIYLEMFKNDWFFLAIYKPYHDFKILFFFPGPNRDNHGIKGPTG